MADAVDGGDAEAEGDGAEHARSASRRRGRRAACGAGSASPSASVAMPSGMLMANRYGQVPIDRMPAAIVGPTAAETATTSALMPMPRPSMRVRIGEAHQRRVDAHDPGRAKALHDARHRQQQQRVRQRAEQRCQREQQQPRQIDPAIADDLAQRCQRQQRDRDRQLIAVDDPDRKGRAGVQIPGDGRQRDIGDGAVDHRHDKPERDGEDRPIALRLGQAIGVLGYGGRHAVDMPQIMTSTGYRLLD